LIIRFSTEISTTSTHHVNFARTPLSTIAQVTNLIFARFTKSVIMYQQMRGRGTRKAHNKPVFTMFDFVGVSDYHGDDEGYALGGVVAVPKAPKKHYEARRLLSLDINDNIDPTTREWVTIDEDGNMVFPEASEQKANELGARFEAWLVSRIDLTPAQENLLRVVGSQIRANADAWDEFTSGHFAFHPFSAQGGYQNAVRVFGGEKYLEDILESLNANVFVTHNDTIQSTESIRPANTQ
jgi:type I restriction enzyme R subunit